MAAVLSCVNLKGGVGKTALAVNFSAYCGMKGLKTLLIDLDPQTNATFSCMTVQDWQIHSAKCGTVANLLGARNHTSAEGKARDVHTVIKKDVHPNVDLIPSHLDLFTVDLDLGGAAGREKRLNKAVKPVVDDYDIIVCDCPPNLTIPTQNAIAMSTHFVVPVSPDFLSAIGVALLVSRVKELWEALDLEQPMIEHVGIVLSRVGRPAEHRTETITTLRDTFEELVLPTQITERVDVSKAAASTRTIFDMGNEAAASEFRDVSKEILKRMKVKVTK